MEINGNTGSSVPFTIDIEDVLRLFGTEGMLYSRDHDVFLRELIQNSMDAIIFFKTDEMKAGKEVDDYIGDISISYINGTDHNSVVIEDNGRGLDEYEFRDHLLHPLKGLPSLLKEKGIEDRSKIIGYFGVGLLSAFKVSDLIEIESKKDSYDSQKLTLRLKRSQGDGKLDPEALLEPFNKETHGTKIIIHLKSKDAEVNRRISMIDSSEQILKSIKYYIRHPNMVRITFTDENGKTTELETETYKGCTIEPHREINISGVRGYIAYRSDSEMNIFQACQKGILINENYQALLPKGAISLIGEIDLMTTNRVNLSLSREEILDNDKFKKLKKDIAIEIAEFIKNEFQTWYRKMTVKKNETQSDESLLHEDSGSAFDLLVKMCSSELPEIIKSRIFNEVAFYVESEEKYMLIDDIENLCEKKDLKKVYIYSADTNTCYPILSLNKTPVYVCDLSHEIYVDVLKDTQQIVIRLNERSLNNPLPYSFKRLIQERLDEKGIKVADILSVEDKLNDEEIPDSPVQLARLVRIKSRKDKVVYRVNGADSFEKILINAENEGNQKILGNLDNILNDERKKTIYDAYLNLQCGNFDESLDILTRLLTERVGTD